MEKIINNSIIFVLAYFVIFVVAQLSTILPAFSHNIPVIVYSTHLDFNTLTSAASNEILKSADNIIKIFGSAIVILALLIFLSIILLLKWKSKKIFIQKLLFWITICSFIRFCDSFICGHLFSLWSFNLVTDFIGLTFPSNIGRAIFIIVIFIILCLGMYFFRELIPGILNPTFDNFKKEVKNTVIYPSILGSILVLIAFSPITSRTGALEVTNCLITPLCIASLFRMGVAKKFSLTNRIKSNPKKERLSIPLIVIVLALAIPFRVIFDQGIKITPNTYDNYILENLLSFVVISSLSLLALYLLFAYFHHHRKQKEEKQEQIKADNAFKEMRDKNMFTFDNSKNMNKYNKAWQEFDQEK